jgi:serine protease AprX
MDKLEPRLEARIMERKSRAADYGFTARDVEEHAIEVTISHVEKVTAPYLDLPEDPERQQEVMQAEASELKSRAAASMDPIVSYLEKLGVEQSKLLPLANAVTTRLTPAQMRAVSAMDEVELIRWETIDDVATMHESVRVIEAFEVWREFNIRGTGIKVAVLDSGVDRTHPALQFSVIDEVDTTGQGILPAGSHGTHVAGTIASRDPVYQGVAPEAQIINVKVLTAAGGGQPAWVIAGLEEAVRRGARVANLSLGWSEPLHGWVCNDADCILCRAADNASRLGVSMIVAAGNEGGLGGPALKIRHPGAAREVVTVAAVDKGKVLAGFSSPGPGSARVSPGSSTRITKPDIAAPGVSIRSTVPGGGFANFNGTSMASPHVAGVAALAIQQHPEARPMTIKKLLEHTSEALPYSPPQVGYGMLNAYSIVAHR